MTEPEDLTLWLESNAWQQVMGNSAEKIEPAWPLGEFVGGDS
jgi:hypothetical protein